MFRQIINQDRAINILQSSIISRKIANSYLFYGHEGVGKFKTALLFGMALNCHTTQSSRPCGVCSSCRKFLSFSHPDFLYIFPTPNINISLDGEIKNQKFLSEYQGYIENKIRTPHKQFVFSGNSEIRIDMIRMLQHRINMTPNESSYKVYIVENADKMNTATANAFLKTLEEPPGDSIIILTTSQEHSLLPTILSRCQKIPFNKLSNDSIEKFLFKNHDVSVLRAKTIAKIANGNLEHAINLVEEDTGEARQIMFHFLSIIVNQNEIELLDMIKRSRGNVLNNILKELLVHLSIFFSDIAMYKNHPDEIANIDKTEIFDLFYEHDDNVDTRIHELLNYFQAEQSKLKRHVNPQLILMDLFLHISKFFSFR